MRYIKNILKAANEPAYVEIVPEVGVKGFRIGYDIAVKDSKAWVVGVEPYACNSTVTLIGFNTVALDDSKGFQVGARNQSYGSKMKQIGGLNEGFDSEAVQIGYIDRAGEKGNYLQFGLITRRDGPWYKAIIPLLGWSPLFGWRRTQSK